MYAIRSYYVEDIADRHPYQVRLGIIQHPAGGRIGGLDSTFRVQQQQGLAHVTDDIFQVSYNFV